MLGAVPARFGQSTASVSLETYFAMARGGVGQAALEMTKWFDTNYHYIVPELEPGARFRLSHTKVIDHFSEARDLGVAARPVLLGPVTFLALSKTIDPARRPLSYLERILPVYGEVLHRLEWLGADWVQVDEPILVTDLDEETRRAVSHAYRELSHATALRIMLATYFGALGENLGFVTNLPVSGIHVDLVRGGAQFAELLSEFPKDKTLSSRSC